MNGIFYGNSETSDLLTKLKKAKMRDQKGNVSFLGEGLSLKFDYNIFVLLLDILFTVLPI